MHAGQVSIMAGEASAKGNKGSLRVPRKGIRIGLVGDYTAESHWRLFTCRAIRGNFSSSSRYGIQRGVEKVGDCDVGRVMDGDVVSLAEMSSLAVDLSFGAPYVEAVFGEGFCCKSQLAFVVELAVSERVQSLVEE